MKNFCIAVLLVVMAGVCFAQAPKSSLSVPTTDVFVGYIMTSPDYGEGLFTYRFNGFEGAFSKGLTSHFAVVATGDVSASATIYPSRDAIFGHGGRQVQLSDRPVPSLWHRAGWLRASELEWHVRQRSPSAAGPGHDVDGLTYRMGGGADLQMTPKIYWRILQWDVQPMPWGRHTPDYVNFSSGIGYRF